MDHDDIHTSYDLADFLEQVARLLRRLPEMELTEKHHRSQRVDRAVGMRHEVTSEFATQLGTLDRDQAGLKMATLSVRQLREIGTLFQVRMPSRVKKSDAIATLLSQLFDMPAGQELLRTFHERHRSV